MLPKETKQRSKRATGERAGESEAALPGLASAAR